MGTPPKARGRLRGGPSLPRWFFAKRVNFCSHLTLRNVVYSPTSFFFSDGHGDSDLESLKKK